MNDEFVNADDLTIEELVTLYKERSQAMLDANNDIRIIRKALAKRELEDFPGVVFGKGFDGLPTVAFSSKFIPNPSATIHKLLGESR